MEGLCPLHPHQGHCPCTRAVPWTQFRMQQTVSFIQFPGEAWGTMRGFAPHPSRVIDPAPISGNSNLFHTNSFPVKWSITHTNFRK